MGQEKKVSTYIVENDNNTNLMVHSVKSTYCLKCGKKIDEDRFCDDDCRRDYYAELRRDCDAIYNNVF